MGVVRGCRCIVDEIVCDDAEPPYDQDPAADPHVLQFVPEGVVLRVPDATWIKDKDLGPGRFFLGRCRRQWSYELAGDEAVDHMLDKKGKKYFSTLIGIGTIQGKAVDHLEQ